MQTVKLSENAVAVLRFCIKGYRMPATDRRLDAYRELAAARILEPVPGSASDYRFTGEGMEHREAILEREAERIERERYEPPDASDLSDAAKELLRTCIERGYPDGDESNRPAYRELVKARIMIPMGSFSKGDECVFRFTYWGYKRRYEFAGMDCAKAEK
jgi:hypothetical protein